MNYYAVFVDSSADLDPGFARTHEISYVAMSYTMGEESGPPSGRRITKPAEAFMTAFAPEHRPTPARSPPSNT